MRNFEIHPHKGVNNVLFGMTPSEVEKNEIGGNYEAVRNVSPDYLTYVISENDDAAFFHFDSVGKLFEIEFSNGMSVTLNGVQLGSVTPAKQLIDSLSDKGIPIIEKEKDVKELDNLGIKIWIEDPEEDKVGSILVTE